MIDRALLILILAASVAPADEIVLRRTVRTEPGAEVRLADVARLSGPLAERIGDTVLIEAAGERTALARQQIRQSLERAHEKLNWGRLSLRGGPVAVIARERTRPDPRPAPTDADADPGPTVREHATRARSPTSSCARG